jgi:DNA adenine methylase
MGFGTDALLQLKQSGFRSGTRVTTSTGRNWRALGHKIEATIDRLQGVVIEHRDALEVMAQQDTPNCLHYVDPPYVLSTRAATAETRGYRHEMKDDDHRKLAEFLNGLQGAVIVSGYDSPLYAELFSGWRHESRTAFADGGRKRTEHLWLRNVAAPVKSPNLTLFS